MNKFKIIVNCIKIITVVYLGLMSLLVYKVFLDAFYNEEKLVLVTINVFNEASVEFVLIPLFLLISLVGVVLILKDVLSDSLF